MAGQLIPYDVIYCSSEEESHGIDQLVGRDYHSIAMEEGTLSWQSRKGSPYPQVLVLRFPGNASLHQLRLLSHEVKIASKVEVQVYELSKEALRKPAPSFENVNFTKLGFVQFSDNEHTHFKSKERKTIHLKTMAYFVKLLFYDPYKNAMNRAEQVGLYAIECVGEVRQTVRQHADPIPTSAASAPPRNRRPKNPSEPSSQPRARRHSSVSVEPVSSGPFRSAQLHQFDNFFVHRAEELMALMATAGTVNDFATEAQCREKMNVLNSLAIEIYSLEQQKIWAVVEENFAEAGRFKDAMEELMNTAVREAQLPAPRTVLTDLEEADPVGEPEPPLTPLGSGGGDVLRSNEIPSPPVQFSTTPHESESRRRARFERQSSIDGGAEPALPLEPSISMVSVDDIEVNPVSVDMLRMEDIASAEERAVSEFIFNVAGEEEKDHVFPPDVLFETRRLASSLGYFVTACLLSKRFKLREAALLAITERMSDVYASSAADVEDSVLRFLDYSNYGLQDNFPNVVLAACIYIRLCIADEHSCIEQVSNALSLLVPRLMTRAADPMPRIREEAIGTLEAMIVSTSLPSSVFVHAALSDPVDKDRAKVPTMKPRPQLARLFVLQALLQENRLSNFLPASAATPGPLKNLYSSLLLPCINHTNSEVRDIATTITQTMVKDKSLLLKKPEVTKIRNPALRDAVIGALKSSDAANEKPHEKPEKHPQEKHPHHP